MADLLELADRLYAEPPTSFTAARDAAAKQTDDRDLARRIKALRKPSIAAWGINLLVRRESEQIDQVLGMAASLRQAAAELDGAGLRDLTRQRRRLTTALAASARGLAREHGVRLSPSVVDQIEDMLNAAMLDPLAARVVRSGLVLTGFTATGVGDLDVTGIVAVPEAIGSTDHAATAVQRAPVSLSVVPEDDSLRLAKAQDAVDRAREEVEQAEAELRGIEESLATLDARRLQLAEEIDEVRRRLATLESDRDEVEDEIEDAEIAREDADAALRERIDSLGEAEKALARAQRPSR